MSQIIATGRPPKHNTPPTQKAVRSLWLLFLGVAALLLASCGGSPSSDSTGNSGDASPTTDAIATMDGAVTDSHASDGAPTDAAAPDAMISDGALPDGGSDGAAGSFSVPSMLSFSSTILGSSSGAQGLMIMNTGPGTITVTSATVTGADFTVDATPLPVMLASGAQTTLNVTFSPMASGPLSESITIGTDVAGSKMVSLMGTGLHAVHLTWNASTSPNIIGYNVYRGLQTGGPYMKINTALVPMTSYTDTSVVKCTTYYYVTTAVDSSMLESVYSNETIAMVPCT